MNLNEVLSLGNQLMVKHGLILMGWKFELDNAVRRFGVCNYRKKVIGISKHLAKLNDVEQVKDTILHEIAHALVGRGHGHDHVWKMKCIEIGAKPERCYSDDTNTPKLRYYAVCGACGVEHEKARLVRKNCKRACNCQKHLPWDKKVLLTYKDRNAA